jgi:hypothetical protein
MASITMSASATARTSVVGRHFSLIDAALQVRGDGRHRAREEVVGDVDEAHVEAARRRGVGDPVAHRAAADDDDVFHFRCAPGCEIA